MLVMWPGVILTVCVLFSQFQKNITKVDTSSGNCQFLKKNRVQEMTVDSLVTITIY